MTTQSTPDPRCESCNVPWREHRGIVATCAELRRLRGAVERFRDTWFRDAPAETLEGMAAAQKAEHAARIALFELLPKRDA